MVMGCVAGFCSRLVCTVKMFFLCVRSAFLLKGGRFLPNLLLPAVLTTSTGTATSVLPRVSNSCVSGTTNPSMPGEGRQQQQYDLAGIF